MNVKPDIRLMVEDDWKQVKQIYHAGIATGNVTFESQVPGWIEWKQGHDMHCVPLLQNMTPSLLVGRVSERCVYSCVGESSVYVHPKFQGQGVGKQLLSSLIERSEEHGNWTIQTGIFPENRSSIVLHARLGFRIVGLRERLGKMGNRWRDVVLLERRSKKSGID